MGEIVVYFAVIEANIEEKVYHFTGIGLSLEVARQRAIDKMHEAEYMECIHFGAVTTTYGTF